MDIPSLTERMRTALREGAIGSSPEDIAGAAISNPLIDPHKAPGSIIRPANAEEVKEVIRLANDNEANLTVASSAGDHYRGGTAASCDNVLLDLSQLKDIGWINRRNRVFMIEPGVTYGELLEALAPHGMTVSMPLAPRGNKSVVAAVMDREPSTWPNRQWDASDPVASTEFIFGNGELFRTGAAGGPGTLEQQRAVGGAQKSSAGPSQTDFHRIIQGAQGTMGVVTWITMRAELVPSIQNPLLVGADSMEKLIPFVYEVQRAQLGEHSFIVNRSCAAMLMSALNGQPFTKIHDSLPPYMCLQNIAGFERMPKERVEYQSNDIRGIAEQSGLTLAPDLGAISAEGLLKASANPCENGDWRRALRGHCLSIFFLTTLDRIPNFCRIFSDSAKTHSLDEECIGCYVQPVVQNHACYMEFMIPFAGGDQDEFSRLRAFERETVRALADAGAFFSRPYGRSQEIVFEQNPLNHETLKKLKGIFDPNRIFNRGKWDL
jgi:FAD/FMN-containing dehydrogenase